ncbi:MAG: putative ABC transporter permease [Lawsonibacter sp.]|jgi:uncharacterized membrane protein
MDYSFYQLLWFFLIYAFAGWIGETALAAAKKGRLLNRGFLNTPFSPVYGLAGVLFAIFLPELRSTPFFLFLYGTILATGLELITGILLERIFRQKWWDYSNQRFQFEGHVCLKYSILWGIFSIICVYFTNPLLIRVLALFPEKIGRAILLTVFCILAGDLISSSAALLQLNNSLKDSRTLSKRLRWITNTLDNAVTRYVQRRMARAYPSLEPERLKESVTRHASFAEKATVFAQGCCFYKLACLFFLGAFLGDIIETLFCRATAGVWMSRSSVVYGPFSIVWGFGAVLLTALLYKYRTRSDRYIFFIGTVVGGAYEYACSVFTELVFGTVFWDYSHLPFNLGGRINLLYCFFWGFACVFWLKSAYPILSSLIERLPIRLGKLLTWGMIVFMLFNISISCLALGRYTQRHHQSEPPETSLSQFLDRHFPDERMERIYPNAILVS